MHARCPAEAVEVLNLLLKFFGNGARWVKGRFNKSSRSRIRRRGPLSRGNADPGGSDPVGRLACPERRVGVASKTS
jgi:hypothetical protein